MRMTFLAPVVAAGLLAGATARAGEKKEQLPRLDWEKEVICTQDHNGSWVRMQCDHQAPGGPKCLVAPNQEAGGEALRRVRGCAGRERYFYRQLQESGVVMTPAIAESPPGWYRDEKGRVFQITFDLMKRFYLGAAWLPGFGLDEGTSSVDRLRLDMGLVASWISLERRNRHTIRALEGFVVLEDLEARGLLFAYDLSHASTTPLMRITTFFGKPARHDLFMDIGFGFSVGDLHVHPHRAESLVELEFGEVHMLWDLFQSADLYNHLQLAAGLGVGGLWNDREGGADGAAGAAAEALYFLLPKLTLQARFGLDWEGFHYLLGDLHAAMPVLLSGEDAGKTRARAGAGAAYEVIFLAINDQPLSLRLEAGLDYRDDLPQGAPKWDATLMAGVRFSFWAPARIHEDLPAAWRR